MSEERDHGVVIDGNLEVSLSLCHSSEQCKEITWPNKASNLSSDTFTKLYKSIVHPCVEHGNLIWGPFFIAGCNRIENIKRKATRMVSDMRDLEYQERLEVLKLLLLKYQRYRGDMITLYNLTHSNYDANFHNFSTNPYETRGHNLKLFKKQSNLGIRRNLFSRRVIDSWNNLPGEIVNAATISNFIKTF